MFSDVVVLGASRSMCPGDPAISNPHNSKTTTMLFKMLGIDSSWNLNFHATNDGTIDRPRQLFVTQSRVLAEKVEEFYHKLTESHAAAMRCDASPAKPSPPSPGYPGSPARRGYQEPAERKITRGGGERRPARNRGGITIVPRVGIS